MVLENSFSSDASVRSDSSSADAVLVQTRLPPVPADPLVFRETFS